jgi:SAM-dependent methyltransferase
LANAIAESDSADAKNNKTVITFPLLKLTQTTNDKRIEIQMNNNDEQNWFAVELAICEQAYLAGNNPRQQSGFGRDEQDWQRYRQPITEAINKNGTFLDIGCANGLLMESIYHWAAQAGYSIEPYGLDISEKLAELARTRLPQWRDRIFVGNALYWHSTNKFDFVRTELVYVPNYRRRDYLQHLLAEIVAPAGRLIVCSYGSSRPEGQRAEDLTKEFNDWGISATGIYELISPEHGFVTTRVLWINKD